MRREAQGPYALNPPPPIPRGVALDLAIERVVSAVDLDRQT